MVALTPAMFGTPPPGAAPWVRRKPAAEPSLAPDELGIAEFLRGTLAEAIQLVAIVPEGAVEGRWFGGDADAAGDWAAARTRAGANVYWTVNRARDGLNAKPKKADIVAARFAHVDIDPPSGGAWDKAAALDALAQAGASFKIDSGGGVQGFWRLDAEEGAEEVEAVNRGLQARFGGDACWNVDRLMRLPGTINWPDARKRGRGRVPALATIASADDGTTHHLATLARDFPTPTVLDAPAKRGAVDATVTALITADDLGLGAFDPVRMTIEQPGGRDRSRDAQACAGDMVRAGFSDAQVMGVLLNPANAVSAHCLAQGNPNRAAARCLSRARGDQDRREAETAEGAAIAASLGLNAQSATKEAGVLHATPYLGRDAGAIPLRPWVYGRQLLRNTVAAVVAPGGVGKSSLMVGIALSLATGRALLAKPVWGGPKRVWLWNLEDDGDELARQIEASSLHHGVQPADYADRLFVDSGLDGQGLCTAVEGRDGVAILKPVYEALASELTARGIDVLIVDPFVSSHQVDENANTKIDAIAKEWARLAKRCACAIVLVHHAGKLAGKRVTSEASRGASALVAAARSTLVLNRLDDDDGKRLGIPIAQRRRFFSVGDDKHNRAPAEEADWYRLESVSLGNGGIEGGDSVGVVAPWTPPKAVEQLDAGDLWRVQNAIARGSWRLDAQAKSTWAGVAVAETLGLSLEDDRPRVKDVLKQWVASGALKIVQHKNADTNYFERSFVEVGAWAEKPHPSPSQGDGNEVV